MNTIAQERDALREEMTTIRHNEALEEERDLRLRLASIERRFKALEFHLHDIDSPESI